MDITQWKEFAEKQLAAAQARDAVMSEKIRVKHEALVAANRAKSAAEQARLKAKAQSAGAGR